MDIHESVDRILDADVVLGDRFYEVFFSRHPEISQYFEGVNLQRQAVMVTMAMLVIEQNYQNRFPAAQRYVRELGGKHREWGIPAETYPAFQAALLEALEDFHGADWNESLAQQWREAIALTIEQMVSAYDEG